MIKSMKNGDSVAQSWIKNLDGVTTATKRQVAETIKSANASIKAGESNVTVVGSLEKMRSGMTASTNAITKFGDALKGALINMGAALVVSALIKGLSMLIDKIIVTREELKEAADAAHSAVKETESTIESLNSKLDETKSRIEELQDKKPLTLTEEAELERLEAQTKELETQLDIQNRIYEMGSKTDVDATKKLLSTKNYSEDYANPEYMRINILDGTLETHGYMGMRFQKDILQETIDAQTGLNKLTEEQEHLNEIRAKGIGDMKQVDKQIEENNKKIEAYNALLSENMSTIHENMEDWFDETGQVKAGYEDLVDMVYGFDKTMSVLTDDGIGTDLKNVVAFFNGSPKTKPIETYLKNITEQGGSASEAIKKLGINLEELDIDDAVLDRYFKELIGDIEQTETAYDKVKSAANDYFEEIRLARDEGIHDLNKTQFGNIDLANRQVLKWTEENTKLYKEAIESWGGTVDDYLGYISTVAASSGEFDGIEIAFTPMLQTESGKPIFLDSDTVYSYIDDVVREAKKRGGDEHWQDFVLEIDSEGFDDVTKDGVKLQNLIADIGDTAIDTSIQMHYLGTDGSVALMFQEIKKAADEAGLSTEQLNNLLAELTREYDGTFESVSKAIESANQGANYDTIVSNLATVEELYEKGLIGTDDFEAMAQFMSKSAIDLSTAEHDSIAYLEAYENNVANFKKYFTEDLTGVYNAINDLESAELLTTTDMGDYIDVDFTDQFKSSKDAAEKLNLSLDATELILHKLEEAGIDFGESFEWAGEIENGVKSGVETLKTLQSELEKTSDPHYAKRLANEIDELDQKILDAEVGKAELTKDDVVRIDFLIDLAGLQQQIDEAKLRFDATGGKDVTENASLITSQVLYINEAMSELGLDEAHIPVSLDVADNAREELFEKLKSAEYGSEEYFKIQTQITNINDMEQELIDAFVAVHPEITPDTDPQVVLDTFNEYMSNRRVPIHLDADLDLEDAFNLIQSTSEKTLITFNADIDDDDVVEEVEAIKNENGTITFTAEVDGETLRGIINEDGTITYIASVDEVEEDLNGVKNKDGTVTYTADVDDVETTVKAVEDEDGNITYTANVDGVETTVTPIKDQKGTITFTAALTGISSIIQTAKEQIKAGLSGGGGGKVTGKNQLSGTLSGSAFKNGTNNSIYDLYNAISSNAKTRRSATALIGEVGPEMVVTGNRWTLAGENGAEFRNIPKGSVVFNAQQTEELFKNGFTNSRGYSFLSGTAYKGGGIRKPSATTSSTSSKSSSSSSSSNTSSKAYDNTASSIDNANEAAEEFLETIDWIETAIERLEESIESLDKTASATYKSWGERTGAIAGPTGELVKYYEEINLQQQAYNRYMQQANSIGLDGVYAAKVRNGEINIEDIRDENLKQKISDYQTWYEKAVACSKAIEDINDKMIELRVTLFENVEKQFDAVISRIEHNINIIEQVQERLEAIGYSTSKNLLQSQRDETVAERAKAFEKFVALRNELNAAVGDYRFEVGSEQWNELNESVNEAYESVLELDTAIAKLDADIRQLEWDRFDYTQERLSRVQADNDFLIDLLDTEHQLFEENGDFTSYGNATLGLRNSNYNAYLKQSEMYANEIKKLNSQIASDPANQTLIDRRNELLDQQKDLIKGYEDEKKAIQDLYTEAYNKYLSYVQKLINARKEELDATKDLYDYQRQVDEQTKTIGSLQKQIMSLSGDNSEENKATLQKLSESLKEAQQNLSDTEYDHWLTAQTKLMDNFYDELEELVNQRLDDINYLFEMGIAQTQENTSTINDTIISEVSKVNYDLNASSGGVTNRIVETNTLLQSILSTVQQMYAKTEQKATATATTAKATQTASTGTSTVYRLNNPNGFHLYTASAGEKDTLVKNGWKLEGSSTTTNYSNIPVYRLFNPKNGDHLMTTSKAESDNVQKNGWRYEGIGFYSTNSSNGNPVYRLYNPNSGEHFYTSSTGERNNLTSNGWRYEGIGWYELKKGSYATGGIIGDAVKKSGEDGIILAKKGEGIFSIEQMKEMENVLNAFSPFANISKNIGMLSNIPSNIGNLGGDNSFNIAFELPNVTSSDEFITFMQNDKRFERILQQMCLGGIVGQNSMNKYRL